MDGATELTQKMIEQRGGREEPSWTWLATADPEFMHAYNVLAQRAFGYHADGSSDPSALSPKIKELVAIAILAGQRDWDRLPGHLQRLIELGASDREILDSLEIAATITGGPAMRMGIEVLQQVRSELRGRESA